MDLELEALNVNEGGLLLECKEKKIRNILSGTSYVFNYLLNQTSLHNVPLDESNIQIVDKLIIKVKQTYCSTVLSLYSLIDKLIIKVKQTYCSTVLSMNLFSFIMFDLSSFPGTCGYILIPISLQTRPYRTWLRLLLLQLNTL